MNGGELAMIVIEGRREDRPGGARTLTPREPTREPNGTPLVRGRARSGRRPGVVPGSIDDGAERSVASGFIDITARDARGAIVVVELKTGTARQGAVAQVLSYMGDIAEEEPDQTVRGLLVAGDFDKKARSAARVLSNQVLSLRSYRIRFEFKDVDET